MLIGQDRVGKRNLRKYLRSKAEVVAKELLSSSKERSDRAQLFPREGKKTKGSEKGDVPNEKKKNLCLGRIQLKTKGKYKRKSRTKKKIVSVHGVEPSTFRL